MRREMKGLGRRSAGGYLFASPWLIGFVLLFFLPMAMLGVIAWTRWDGLSLSSLRWVGTSNFRALASDPLLRKAIVNSVTYTAMNVPCQLAAGLALALLIRRSRRVGWWATLYYLPHVLCGVATILIWWWLLNPQIGPVNRAISASFERLGLNWPLPPWLYSPTWAKPSLVLMNLWHSGGCMLVFLAALLRQGPLLHEAAAIDGAGRFRRFWHITLPQISPAILFNALTGVIFSMQEFDQPLLLSNYQQQDSLLFIAMYLYQTAFERHRFGDAAAVAWLTCGLLLAFTAGAVAVARRYVRYDMEDSA